MLVRWIAVLLVISLGAACERRERSRPEPSAPSSPRIDPVALGWSRWTDRSRTISALLPKPQNHDEPFEDQFFEANLPEPLDWFRLELRRGFGDEATGLDPDHKDTPADILDREVYNHDGSDSIVEYHAIEHRGMRGWEIRRRFKPGHPQGWHGEDYLVVWLLFDLKRKLFLSAELGVRLGDTPGLPRSTLPEVRAILESIEIAE